MNRDLLHLSTILRYPKKKRPNYQTKLYEKLRRANMAISLIMDDIPRDEQLIPYSQDLYEKLPENLTSPRFHYIASLVGNYTQTRIVCRNLLVADNRVIKTYTLWGNRTSVISCYLLLRCIYYSMKWGISSNNQSSTANYLIVLYNSLLELLRIDVSKPNIADSEIISTYNLKGPNSPYTIATINRNKLPKGKFKHNRLIC